MIKDQIDRFFAYARERETIRLRKLAGDPLPWTSDPILAHYRFCNVRREHDRVTEWFRENVRDPMRDDPGVVLATFIFRWFNRIETGKILLEHNLLADWNVARARGALHDVAPLVTGAFMIKTPTGLRKLEGIISIVERYIDMGLADRTWYDCKTLQSAWNVTCAAPFMGDFMSYELVTDLRHTACLEDASDILTWANPGPGCMRGLDRMHGDPVPTRGTAKSRHWDGMQLAMQQLLELSGLPENWPPEWGAWEMREVEHTLCEFDKYERTRLREGRPKKKYRPGAPS